MVRIVIVLNCINDRYAIYICVFVCVCVFLTFLAIIHNDTVYSETHANKYRHFEMLCDIARTGHCERNGKESK